MSDCPTGPTNFDSTGVFYIPEPLVRGYKTHNEFYNSSYGMKIHLRFFLSHELTRNEQKQDGIVFFRESGTDDKVTCYALIKKFA